MPKEHEPSRGDHLGQEDSEVRAAIRFTLIAAAVGVGFLILAALLVNTCHSGTGPRTGIDTVTCGAPERITLAFGAPVILFGCGIHAFIRTYRIWRAEGTWWGWQGAGWFLLIVALLTLTLGVPPIAGPALIL